MRLLPVAVLGLMAATVLAGCSSAPGPFDPYADVPETGRTVHLKMTVVDLMEHEVYPGFKANLWAFCAEPANPNDAYSAAALEYWAPIATDGLVGGVAGAPQQGKCGVPGPTIRVTQGDRVIVDFTHSHIHPHTIHWHGQFVPDLADGAPGVSQRAVQAGEAFRYEFIAKKAGTLWYHCHVDTQLHVMQGLYGLFIVEPQDKSHDDPLVRDIPKENEHYLVMGDLRRSLVEAVPGVSPHRHQPGCLVSGTPGCQNPPVDTTPDTYLLNGHSYPHTDAQMAADGKRGTLIELHEGRNARIRVLNAGQEFETLHPHGHDILVTHRDGNPLPQPFWVDTLTIGPAERYDVVIVPNNPGIWMLHTHVNDHETNDFQSGGGMHTMMVYHDFMDKMDRFRSGGELPGGLPYQRNPQAIPSDILRQEAFPVQSTPDGSAGGPTHSFNVPMACAVQGLSVTISSKASSTLFQRLNNLTVDVTNAQGDLVSTFRLGEAAEGRWSLEPDRTSRSQVGAMGLVYPSKPLVDGNFTIQVKGRMVETAITITSLVDFYDSFEQAKQASHIYNYADCRLFPER